MPGMNSGLDPSDPTVVAAFQSALLHQGIAALVIFAVLSLAWVVARDRHPAAPAAAAAARPGPPPEPSWRRVLRTGFGVLWLFDGLLQAQPAMAVGMPSQVIEPTAASSPPWVQHLVNWAGTTWSYHPVEAGAAAVWIQVGIGLWLLFAARGPLPGHHARLRRQPGRGGSPGRARRDAGRRRRRRAGRLARPAPRAAARGGDRAGRAVRRGLGAGAGLRLLRLT